MEVRSTPPVRSGPDVIDLNRADRGIRGKQFRAGPFTPGPAVRGEMNADGFEVLLHVERTCDARGHVEELALFDRDRLLAEPHRQTAARDDTHLVVGPAKVEVNALAEADEGEPQDGALGL